MALKNKNITIQKTKNQFETKGFLELRFGF